MLTMEQLQSIKDKVKEVTGIYAWFNDKSESTNVIKFDLKYKGLSWLNPMRKGILKFDLILCGYGVGDAFNLNIANTEIEISKAFQIVSGSDQMIHDINTKDSIELIWNDDDALVESETTTAGIKYSYKRYFKLNYTFKNS